MSAVGPYPELCGWSATLWCGAFGASGLVQPRPRPWGRHWGSVAVPGAARCDRPGAFLAMPSRTFRVRSFGLVAANSLRVRMTWMVVALIRYPAVLKSS